MKVRTIGIIGAVEEKKAVYDGKESTSYQVALIVGTEALTLKSDEKDFLNAPLYKPVDLELNYNPTYKSLKLLSFAVAK